MSKDYTTGVVAKFCGVSLQTVKKWCNSGLLKSYRVPGSKHRRITKPDLIAFMETHELPLPDEFFPTHRVLETEHTTLILPINATQP